jgi:hypothetical protein
MKLSSVLSASAIAASTLLTFSAAVFAVSQPVNISTNSELQSLQTAEIPSQKVASWWEILKCKPKHKDCGWS